MINRMKKLEASLPAAAQLQELMPSIKKLREQKKVHVTKINELVKEMRGHQAEKREKYDENKEMFQEKEEKNKEIDAIDKEIKDQKAKIDSFFSERGTSGIWLSIFSLVFSTKLYAICDR